MTQRIPGGASPAIKDGILTWCEGDVFDFTISLKLYSLGELLDDLDDYTFEASFYDAGGGQVHKFTEESEGSCDFTLSFTPAVSAKFHRGKYRYDVAVTTPDGKKTTVANDVPAAVR